MEMLYKGKISEVWEISKTGPRPDWVVDAFSKGYMVWADQRLRIKMAFIHPSGYGNLVSGLTGGVGGYVGGMGQLIIADEGDFLDATRGEIVSAKKFAKKYEKIE